MRRALRNFLTNLLTSGLIIAAAVAICGDVAEACQYTVRDVAFVDLGDSPYRLYVFSQGDSNEALKGTLSKALDDASGRLDDSNVVAELVDMDVASKHTAVAYLETANVTTFPVVVLVSPDNRVLQLGEGSGPVKPADLDGLIQSVIESAVRDDIFSRVLDIHSVMIVIEGGDAAPNAQTTQMAKDFIPRVRDILDVLPKPIDHPPHLIVLTREQAKKERILLWSLGVDLEDESITQVAVLFGRGRRLGPVLRFPGDDSRKFERSLAAVGQDCECGLDRSWMQGGMVPHVWNEATEKIALAKLKFDPGSPEVKTEIALLLSRGPGGKAAVADSELIFPALGYQEIELDVVAEAGVSETENAETAAAEPDVEEKTAAVRIASATPASDATAEATAEAISDAASNKPSELPPDITAKTLSMKVTETEGSSRSRLVYSVLIGLVAFVLVVGVSLLVTGRRENR